jgi:3-deoxy-D-manno-octulosonic-acid transferase
VHVTGSVKFDVSVPEPALLAGSALREQIGPRPVLLCASTRAGEEELILDAMQEADWRDALILIVPRHPQRFEDVAQLIAERGLTMERRTALGNAVLAADERVLLGDSMGEMFTYYAACDLAYIGGSLLPLGGQNLIEACALGKPVLLGPHTFNFSEVSEDAVGAGAALRVADAAAMLRAARHLLHAAEERIAMGAQAHAFAQRHRGATARTMSLLRPLLI